MKTFTFDDMELSKLLNQGKEHLFAALLQDGVLSREACLQITESYALVCHSRGFFGVVLDSVRKMFSDKDDKDVSRITVVKVIQ
jgi:hypothetical protein